MRTRNTCLSLVVAVALGGLLLFSIGCDLDKQGEPNLQGPSDAALSVDLVAQPDTVNRDGVSQSVVRLVLRDNMGRPFSGHPILFRCECDGTMRPYPGDSYVGPVQEGRVMATDADGTARVVYTAGQYSDSIEIVVRPYGIDTQYAFERRVRIWQR